MASIIYKKLFEVRILHDYFLATKEKSFFSSVFSDQQREAILAQKHNFDLANIFNIYPTSDSARLMRNHKLRLIKTRFGFFVAQRVKRVIQASGAVFYKPILPLEDNTGLTFKIKSLQSYFQNFSGIPIRDAIPSLYYFSNEDVDNNKSFPALSLPVPDFTSSQVYEMGELASMAGQLSQAKESTNDAGGGNWQDVEGSGFAHRSDKLLLPRKFRFNLSPGNLPVSITATLSKPEGSLVKSIDIDVKGNDVVLLDFCNNPVDNCVDEGCYDLEIKDEGNNTLFKKKILLNDSLHKNNNFGCIEIFQNSSTDFNLLDNDGFILHRINADQTKVNHPVFEIRFRSRSTYWRYKSKEAFDPADIAATDVILDTVPNSGNTILVATNPESIVEGINKSLGSIDLPNPSPATLKYGTDGKIYSDIYISSINRFLN